MKQVLKLNAQSRWFIISTFICLINFQPLNAQQIIPPNNPELSLLLNSLSRPEVLNVDMLSTTSGPLKAFVTSFESPQSGSSIIGINVLDGTGQSVQKLASGYEADVVLINDGTSTTSYKLCVVYLNNNSDVKLDVYTISGVGTSSLQISNLPITYTIATAINTASTFAGLHIDGFVDPNTMVGGYPDISNIIICWSERNISSNQYSLKVKFGTPSSLTSGTVVQPTSNTLYLSDVAASTNKATGAKVAYLVYVQNQQIYFAQFDVASGNTVASNVIMPFGGSAPIIEATGIFDPNYSKNPWIIANMTANNNFPISVFDQMNLGGFNCNNSLAINSSVSFGVNIAAGLGTSFNNFCNSNYVIGYGYISGSTGNPKYVLTNAVDVGSGSISTTYPDYYQVDNGSCPQPHDYLSPDIAMNSCSNSGNYLLTSWINQDAQGNYRVYYKLVGDITGYKPTSVSSTEVKVNSINLFPNPAHSEITISGIQDATHYVITNIAGQMIFSGHLNDSQNEIDIHQLPAGVYIVHLVTSSGKSTEIDFLKV
ncbi:MAG TPA: T9SS type A sorting domain-containing protein [Edaphocola sp.]|nr:T9SS type A sorting domain-containing protein [Edaphocola sp.]